MANYVEKADILGAVNAAMKELYKKIETAENARDTLSAKLYGACIDVFDDFWNQVEAYEGEDVAPVVHGRWKVGKRTSYGRTLFLCTACKEAGDIPTCMGDPIYKYCPNCGAKMDLEG